MTAETKENPYRLWTYREVIEATTISRRTLQRLIDRGVVKVSATCRGRIPDPEVQKLLAARNGTGCQLTEFKS